LLEFIEFVHPAVVEQSLLEQPFGLMHQVESEVALGYADLLLGCSPQQLNELLLEVLVAALLRLREAVRQTHQQAVEVLLGRLAGLDEVTPHGHHESVGGVAPAGRMEGNVCFEGCDEVFLKIVEN
jgi:hypothetical protein